MVGPHVTTGDDGKTPTTSTQGPSGQYGQPVNAVDGDLATIGAKADAAVTDPALSATQIALLKGLLTVLKSAIPAGDNNIGNVDVVTLPKVDQGVPGPDASPWPMKITGSTFTQAPGSALPSQLALVGAANGAGTQVQALQWQATSSDARADGNGLLSAGYAFGYNGVSWDRVRVANVFTAVSANALASGSLTPGIGTPPTGKKFRIKRVAIRGSVAGRYELCDGAASFRSIWVPANQTVLVEFAGNGYLSTAANNYFYLMNNTGGAADVHGWFDGNYE